MKLRFNCEMYGMQIGWRDYIKSRFKKASKFHSVGIELGTDQLRLSVLQKVSNQLVCVKQTSIAIGAWQNELKTYVVKNHLINTPCNVTLSISKYQLLQVDKPPVQESELKAALQWAIKEQLSNEEEVTLDYFDTPATPNSKKVNVVAIAKREVVEIRDGILSADLLLNKIEVQELSTCNLFENSEDAIISLKQDASGQLSLNIVKQKILFFSRRLKGYENLANFSPDELKMGIADNLSLEIQRSMDYFESQLRQAPVKHVYIFVDTLHQDALIEMIKDVILVPVEKFTPNIATTNNTPLMPFSFISLAAALSPVELQE